MKTFATKSCDVHGVLRDTLTRLSESALLSNIDGPLEQALASFRYIGPRDPWTARTVDEALVSLVRHLDTEGIPPAKHRATFECLAEARLLLDAGYSTHSGRGYDAALVDVLIEGEAAMRVVVDCVGESYREARRSAYVRWVLASSIDPLDWRQRCDLVRELVDVRRDELPDDVVEIPSERLVDCLGDLLLAHIQTDQYLKRFGRSLLPD